MKGFSKASIRSVAWDLAIPIAVTDVISRAFDELRHSRNFGCQFASDCTLKLSYVAERRG